MHARRDIWDLAPERKTQENGQVLNDAALKILEALSHTLAVSGWISIQMGAGNPEYFYQVFYKQDGYGPTGSAHDAPKAIEGRGRTLMAAVKMLQENLACMKSSPPASSP